MFTSEVSIFFAYSVNLTNKSTHSFTNYLTRIAIMASLLVLVQNLTLKVSLACAFKAINNNMNVFVLIESAN